MKKYVVLTERSRFVIEAETVKVNAEIKQIEFYSNQKCNIVEAAADTPDGKEKIIGEGIMQGMVAMFPLESTVFFLKSDSAYDMFNYTDMREYAEYYKEKIVEFPDMPVGVFLKWQKDVYCEKEKESNQLNQIFEAFKTTHYLFEEALNKAGISNIYEEQQLKGNKILIEKHENR